MVALGTCLLVATTTTEPGARWTRAAVDTAARAAPEWLATMLWSEEEGSAASAASGAAAGVEEGMMAVAGSEEERMQGRLIIPQ